MAILAFDYGKTWIGIAVAEPRHGTATPLTTARAKKGRPSWATIDPIVARWEPETLVVGLPLNMDDTESEMSTESRRFGSDLGKRYGVRVQFADERLSSFEDIDSARVWKKSNNAIAATIIA
ncbi:MAG: Holliday junction resolvase RuvX [Pseudomonadota bacterium]|nr:Holliday junction resolvase RuvX [Pseudomonadota bacterium]